MTRSGAEKEGNGRTPRVAIACPGVGLVQRGFERFFGDLFQVVRGECDVTLFKGGGPRRDDEKVLFFADRNSWLIRALPVHKLFHRTPMHSECMTFALAMLPYLRNGGFDVVHTVDPPLTRLLYRLRARFGLRFNLLYTEGCAMPPSDYPPADHTQQVSAATMDEAVAYGYAADGMTLLPCGFFPDRFVTSRAKSELRRSYGVAEDTFVVLSVAALNRRHKRVHHLIDEVAKLSGDILLWLDGSLDLGDADLVPYARQRLGDRCRITHLPSDKIGELYRLADVFAHAAMFESFGLAIVEAAACGLPVIIHDAAHFRWLLPNPNCWTDMNRPGALADRLAAALQDASVRDSMRCQELAAERYAWNRLRSGYVELYRHVAAIPPRLVPETECRLAG